MISRHDAFRRRVSDAFLSSGHIGSLDVSDTILSSLFHPIIIIIPVVVEIDGAPEALLDREAQVGGVAPRLLRGRYGVPEV